MASNTLATKADLAAQLLRIIKRTGVTAFTDETDNIIKLAEAQLNRELPAVETDSTLTGVLNSRRIDITSISLVEPIALFITIGTEETQLRPDPDGDTAYTTVSGQPISWALDGTGSYIDFNCPLDSAYSFRFRNVQRFALATSGATNWLLTNHPDVYLAACVVWGYARMEDIQNAAQWTQQLADGIRGVKRVLMRLKKRTLTVDPMFTMIGNRGGFNINTGDY